MSEEEDAVRRFVEAINAHDLEALGSLIGDDHAFIDSLGRRLQGRRVVLDAWSEYFAWFPDYSMVVEHVVSSGSTVALFGSACGSLADPSTTLGATWRVAAAWRAIVRGRLIVEWQVYADNKPVYELLADSLPRR